MNQLVFIENGQAVTDSLTVAEMFGKRHDNVLEDIRTQKEYAGEEFSLLNFQESTYVNDRGRSYPKYDLTEEAFVLVVMSYNTRESVQLKIKFIQEFKRIKEQLSKQFSVPTSFADALRLAADLQEKIELDKPKVEAHDKFMSGKNVQKMGDVAKVLGWGRNKLFAFLRKEKVLMNDNTPYQKYIDNACFEVKEKPIDRGEKSFNKTQTYVTPKGVDFISKLIDKKIA